MCVYLFTLEGAHKSHNCTCQHSCEEAHFIPEISQARLSAIGIGDLVQQTPDIEDDTQYQLLLSSRHRMIPDLLFGFMDKLTKVQNALHSKNIEIEHMNLSLL